MLRGSARAGCLTEMALLSPHQLRGRSSVPHWAEAGAQTEALEDLPQMTQVLKEVGLESGLMSDPEPALLTPLHPHSSMRKDLDFPTGPRGQNDAWHVWNTGKGKSPSICWDALISRAFFDWEQLPGGWGGVWLASQRHGCTGEGWPGGLKPFQLNVSVMQEVKLKGQDCLPRATGDNRPPAPVVAQTHTHRPK